MLYLGYEGIAIAMQNELTFAGCVFFCSYQHEAPKKASYYISK